MKTFNIYFEGEIIATFNDYINTKVLLFFVDLRVPYFMHRGYGYEVETINNI